MNIKELIDQLGKHFVGLWIYQPYGKKRMWVVTFRDINREYWETDLHEEMHEPLLQAVDVIRRQNDGEKVAPTGDKQTVPDMDEATSD